MAAGEQDALRERDAGGARGAQAEKPRGVSKALCRMESYSAAKGACAQTGTEAGGYQ